MEIKEIGYLKTPFKTKFGVPRQSGAVKSSKATLVFNEPFQNSEALRGLDGYSHVWVIWGFSECEKTEFSPTVRPPRLGGNTRVGVFASRSPFRPNGLALSVLKLEKIEKTEKHGHVLRLSGADMMDNSPVYDIKPYLPQFDSIPYATGGFSTEIENYRLTVIFPEDIKRELDTELIDRLTDILSEDPRPSYINTPDRVYGFLYDNYEIKFTVQSKELTVISIEKK
ncbi:MAG: tRNA (N6-threonylcarbamoyladenosine(37)-N6)-methyltransferase TrmO [Clostridia bacterium]|nr:tRNA (N6-threonylcarbamoyladenosine(37)-N6)-methyltransferase TrmO [Clostridia bacterium]